MNIGLYDMPYVFICICEIGHYQIKEMAMNNFSAKINSILDYEG